MDTYDISPLQVVREQVTIRKFDGDPLVGDVPVETLTVISEDGSEVSRETLAGGKPWTQEDEDGAH